MTARVTSGLLVSALIRRVADAGGAAVVVARGDATAGAIMLICLERGVHESYRERVLGMDGRYAWESVGPGGDSDADVHRQWLDRRRARDPDLWIIELDIANAQRFAAETSGDD